MTYLTLAVVWLLALVGVGHLASQLTIKFKWDMGISVLLAAVGGWAITFPYIYFVVRPLYQMLGS